MRGVGYPCFSVLASTSSKASRYPRLTAGFFVAKAVSPSSVAAWWQPPQDPVFGEMSVLTVPDTSLLTHAGLKSLVWRTNLQIRRCVLWRRPIPSDHQDNRRFRPPVPSRCRFVISAVQAQRWAMPPHRLFGSVMLDNCWPWAASSCHRASGNARRNRTYGIYFGRGEVQREMALCLPDGPVSTEGNRSGSFTCGRFWVAH